MKSALKTFKTLKDKVAIVTGSSAEIGRAAALEFARRGAEVVASARRRPEIDSLVAQIKRAIDPLMRRLRPDPRLTALARKIGLPRML